MHHGLAREYQDRYNSCITSAQKFSRYAGFGFVEENGVCQCNGKECGGNEVCSPHGICEKLNIIKPECEENSKTCISPTFGQICRKNDHGELKWSEPKTCTGNDVCNTNVGSDICGQYCSVNVCHQKDGKAYYSECVDGSYIERQCWDPNVSCTKNDYNTSKCGECRNGYKDYKDEQVVGICVNGQWVECIWYEDDNCYTQQQCVNNTNGGSEILLTTDDGIQIIKNECEYGCDGDHCTNNAVKLPCVEDIRRCVVNTLETCHYGHWVVDGLCANQCNSDSTACNPECDGDAKKCEDDSEYYCDDGKWVKGQLCTLGCNGNVCAEQVSEGSKGSVECKDNVLIICNDGDWETTNCSDDAPCNAALRKCQCTEGDKKCDGNFLKICNASGGWDKHDCGSAGCDPVSAACRSSSECNAGTYKCQDGNIYQCSDHNWSPTTLSCSNGCNADGSIDSFNSSDSAMQNMCACDDGVYYCVNGEAFQCNGGKLTVASGCDCTGHDSGINNDCNSYPDCETTYYQCYSSGVMRCVFNPGGGMAFGCKTIVGKNILLIESHNDEKLNLQWCEHPDVFHCDDQKGLMDSLTRLINYTCSDPRQPDMIQLTGCDVDSVLFVDGWYYVDYRSSSNLFPRAMLYAKVGKGTMTISSTGP